MTAAELIEELKKMPQDAEVWHLWDGALRTRIDIVYLSQSGVIGTAPNGCESIYRDEDRPIGAPSEKEDLHWHFPDEDDNLE